MIRGNPFVPVVLLTLVVVLLFLVFAVTGTQGAILGGSSAFLDS